MPSPPHTGVGAAARRRCPSHTAARPAGCLWEAPRVTAAAAGGAVTAEPDCLPPLLSRFSACAFFCGKPVPSERALAGGRGSAIRRPAPPLAPRALPVTLRLRGPAAPAGGAVGAVGGQAGNAHAGPAPPRGGRAAAPVRRQRGPAAALPAEPGGGADPAGAPMPRGPRPRPLGPEPLGGAAVPAGDTVAAGRAPHVRRAEGGSDGGGRWGAGGAAAVSGRGPTWRPAAGAGRASARCWRWPLWRGWAPRPR